MIRTQIQLSEPLYAELKRVALQCDLSLAEVIRRAGEQFVARYPSNPEPEWHLPGPFDCGGDFLSPPEQWHGEAEAIEHKFRK